MICYLVIRTSRLQGTPLKTGRKDFQTLESWKVYILDLKGDYQIVKEGFKTTTLQRRSMDKSDFLKVLKIPKNFSTTHSHSRTEISLSLDLSAILIVEV